MRIRVVRIVEVFVVLVGIYNTPEERRLLVPFPALSLSAPHSPLYRTTSSFSLSLTFQVRCLEARLCQQAASAAVISVDCKL